MPESRIYSLVQVVCVDFFLLFFVLGFFIFFDKSERFVVHINIFSVSLAEHIFNLSLCLNISVTD